MSSPDHPPPPALLGVPVEFYLFGLMLAGVALFHRRALPISCAGLLLILVYEWLVSRFPTGLGWSALLVQGRIEWPSIANLFMLLIGFEIVASHFERSNLPDHLPNHLPATWASGLALLGFVFLLSAFLDNIAAAVLGGVMARHVYRDRVCVAFVAAIVAAANAGGAGSVIGDTTTTLIWLHGISMKAVLPAYAAALPALLLVAPLGALIQHKHQPILCRGEPTRPIRWRRVGVVAIILAAAAVTNLSANWLGGDRAIPWLGLGLWAAILLTSAVAAPDWSVTRPAAKGALFLVFLVAAASLMPVKALPRPSWHSVFGLGILSSLFDNIPLTALALRQGGYDWPLLAYAVGFGGSMAWFGSSAGVAITNDHPEARSLRRWMAQAWFLPLAYAAGFFLMLALRGWSGA